MVDVFGEMIHGPPGPAGPPGKDGDPLEIMHTWMPSLLLDGFRKSSVFCFYFKKSTDFKWFNKQIVGFESQSDNNTAGELRHGKIRSQTLPKGGYCADLDHAILKVKNANIADKLDTISILIVTFKLTAIPRKACCLIENGNRSVTLDQKNVQIWTQKDGTPFEFGYKLHEWTTLYVQWSYTTDSNRGFVYYGKEHAEVIWKDQEEGTLPNVYIGGSRDKSNFFNGCLAAIELYSISPAKPLPDIIRNYVKAWHERYVNNHFKDEH